MNYDTMNKTAMDNVKRVGEINMRLMERLAEEQIAATSDWLEGGMEQVKLIGNGRDVAGIMNEQTRLMSDLNDKMVGHFKKTAAIMAEAKDEYAAVVEEGMKAAPDLPFAKVIKTA